jgi:hypothetical protein
MRRLVAAEVADRRSRSPWVRRLPSTTRIRGARQSGGDMDSRYLNPAGFRVTKAPAPLVDLRQHALRHRQVTTILIR